MSKDSTALKWVRPARQQRSQRSVQRVLDAAEELFGQQGFEQTSVAQIAAKAGCAVGTVYSRFRDKEALLHLLHQNLAQEAVLTAESALSALDPQLPIDQLARLMVDFLWSVYQQRPKLVLAVAIRVPDDAAIAERSERLLDDVAQRLGAFLARHQDLRLSDPQDCADFTLRLIFGAFHHRALHAGFRPERRSGAAFVEELSRAVAGYWRACG
ncbi:MAG: TetR/AcrR family transcriptional regulator [Deltaproteobacteria bacterium]|nr:TetR/AcrR family transcriptional regulator [Deltaproteobacteria bacterium]